MPLKTQTKFPAFLRGLRRYLAPTKRYRHLLDGVTAPRKGYGRSVWVLSRALYRFARFDLKPVPRPQRGRSLELQIREWSPFPNPGSYVLWDGDAALVWAWDADRVQSAMLECGLKPGSTKVVPETLLQQKRIHGLHLVTCEEGNEGQVWLDGSLMSSRWWAGTPSAADWINFQRDAGVMPEFQSVGLPAAEPLHWQDVPWGKSVALARSAQYSGKREEAIVAAAALCLFGSTIWYGTQLIKLREATRDRTAELQSLNRSTEPVAAARTQAFDALHRIKLLQAIDRYPDQISLMAKVAEVVPKDGTYLKEWEFANGRLRIVLVSPSKPVSSQYIKLFQSLDIFKDVQATAGNEPGSLVVNMEAVPHAEIRFAAAPTAAPAKIGGAVIPPPITK